jgi:hypothetical protein
MRYTSPSGYDFEIPDEWLIEASVNEVPLELKSYPRGKSEGNVKGDAIYLRLDAIAATLDNRPDFEQPGPLDRSRMVPILRALVHRAELPPVWVWRIERPSDKRTHQLCNGHHRYHACLALGLTSIPVLVVTRDEATEPPSALPCGCGGADKHCPLCKGTGKVEWP